MNPFRQGTKRHMIAELLESGKSRTETYQALREMVVSRMKPMVFSANVNGRREPKPMSEQLIELKNEINRVAKVLDVGGDDLLEVPAEDEIPTPEEVEEEEEESKPIIASGKARIENELKRFLKRVREIRKFCEDRARLSETLDSISMRPVLAASKLIPAGIPADALLYSMTMHWPKDALQDAGISEFDYAKLSREIMSERGLETLNGEKLHFLFGYVLTLAECRQNVMLVGPAGTGKSHVARQVADYLEFPYGETPMSPGATRGDLLGRHTIGGFIPSEFVEIYSGGGVFNFEEIDASDPSMLIVLNNALASQSLHNSANGEKYEKHEDFIAVSTANTFGLGANRDYTAREKLDAATIDRWRMGRVFVPHDENVEESLLFAHHK